MQRTHLGWRQVYCLATITESSSDVPLITVDYPLSSALGEKTTTLLYQWCSDQMLRVINQVISTMGFNQQAARTPGSL